MNDNTGIALYDLAKQIMNNEDPMDPIQVNIEIKEIAKKIFNSNNEYYFLICPDLRQYVMFHINDTTIEDIQRNLTETLTNRGSILMFDKDNEDNEDNEDKEIWEIWIRDIYDEQNYVYQLTPYEVIEV